MRNPKMPRCVAAEALDNLPAADPAAIRSRRDLQRIHRWMGTRGINIRALRCWAVPTATSAGPRVLELGAGDGTLMLGIARGLQGAWPAVDLTLLDRQDLVRPATLARYAELGWTARPWVIDVRDWARGEPRAPSDAQATPRWDLVVANLFLHHFDDVHLAMLLAAIAARAERFFACEPRRVWRSLAGSHLVGVIGANAVTRKDAVLSVHAGFRNREITAIWPGSAYDWTLREYADGAFSHCFWAQRPIAQHP